MNWYKIASSSVKESIEQIINEVKSLPDTDVASDLWGKKNDKNTCLYFFTNILNLLSQDEKQGKHELEKRLSVCDLSGDYYSIYLTINEANHPVRNYLILRSHGLLED